MHNPVLAMLIISTGAFLTACQKKAAERTLHAADISQTAAASHNSLKKKDLGVLPLSNHVSTTVTIGQNRECTLTPTLLKSGNLQIILAIETTGADGRPIGMNVERVLARPGEPFSVCIGDTDLAFTPRLAAQ